MESEGSLLQDPTTCPRPEPDESTPHPHMPLMSVLILSFYRWVGILNGTFSLVLPTKTMHFSPPFHSHFPPFLSPMI